MLTILHFLQLYGHFDQHSGEISYYMTCLQASVEFILQLEIPHHIIDKFNLTADMTSSEISIHNPLDDDDVDNKQSNEAQEGDGSIEKLGEWLRDQETMEDTISILQKEGWMM